MLTAIVATTTYMVFGAALPASAEANGTWDTQSDGVAGVSAHGLWEYYDDDSCYLSGSITDTQADGHAAGVQIHVIPDTQVIDGDYYRTVINTGGKGSVMRFSRTYERILRSYHWEGGSVWIREIVTEQGEILRRGGWHLTCDGYGH